MQIEPKPTASAPDEADDMRARVAKLEHALRVAFFCFEECRGAMQSALRSIDADDVIGAHEILVKALEEEEIE